MAHGTGRNHSGPSCFSKPNAVATFRYDGLCTRLLHKHNRPGEDALTMALATIPKHLEELTAMQGPTGGWGYAPDRAPHLEPTCLSLLALSTEAAQSAEA